MSTRVLSKEESESLSFGAVELIYKYLNDGYCTPDVIEKALLHAVVVSRLNQCLVDAGTLSLLMEKISEYEGVPLFGPGGDGEGNAGRYC
ncbi:MAG: hypothetical protein LBK91_03615 [Synergistaceae bacterium]|jgi:hypothetical protein|nr:hypothetical protein [Synergistaceae bacterium]